VVQHEMIICHLHLLINLFNPFLEILHVHDVHLWMHPFGGIFLFCKFLHARAELPSECSSTISVWQSHAVG
jgi:hypothetical protein